MVLARGEGWVVVRRGRRRPPRRVMPAGRTELSPSPTKVGDGLSPVSLTLGGGGGGVRVEQGPGLSPVSLTLP